MKSFFNENKKNAYFWGFFVLAILTLVLLPVLSKDAGMSGDEEFHYVQAERVYNYYKTLGKDSSAAVVSESQKAYQYLPYYGQVVDNFAYLITKTFDIEDVYGTRHIVNAVFGWLAMFFAALIAYRIAGWRAATITLLLMFLSPRFLGHSFNNLKDLPLATGIIFGIYCLVRFLQEFPKVKWKTAILFAISIGFATAVRFAGLLIVAYFGLFGFIYWIIRNRKQGLFKKEGRKELLRMVCWGLGIFIPGFVLAMLLWPFLLQAPIAHLKDTIENMSAFAVAIRQVFEGVMQWSDVLPWYYTPKFILMTIPVAVIVGFLLDVVLCWRDKQNRFFAVLLFFTFIFPIFWIIYQKSNVYGGWRHAMFSYPPMVVSAGLGFHYLMQWVEDRFRQRKTKTVATLPAPKTKIIINAGGLAVVLLLLLNPIIHIIRNHPYEYVYFNELAGGTKHAFGNYEMDYYYHSTRAASEWVIANATRTGLEEGDKIKVATWHTVSVDNFFRNDTARFSVQFARWYERGNSDWDYGIFTVTGISPDYLKSKAFPPKNTVKTIDVDGVPIAVVLKRTDKSDYYAYKLKNANRLDSALILYKNAIRLDSCNDCAYLNMGEIYLRLGQPDSAIACLDRFIAFYPSAENANYLKAFALQTKGRTAEAIDILHQIEKHNFKYVNAYYLAVQIYMQQQNLVAAGKELRKMIDADQVSEQFVKLWLQYYKAQGIDERTAYIKLYKAMVKSFTKRGKTKEAKQYQGYLDEIR